MSRTVMTYFLNFLKKIRRDTRDSLGEEKLFQFLDMEITERCNNDCVHCYINLPKDNLSTIDREMPTRMAIDILSEAWKIGCREVRFTGGEPLLRDDFEDLYSYAARLGMNIRVATNATLITPRISRLFSNKHPAGISISIYGWDQKSYGRTTRRPDNFQAFLDGIARLRAAGVIFQIKMPAVPWLINHELEISALASELGASDPIPFVWELTLRARPCPEKSEQIRRLRLKPEQAVQRILANPERAERDPVILANFQNYKHPHDRLFACRAGKRRLTVDAYGHLQVCLEMRHPDTVYDLKNGTMRDGIRNFIPKVKTIRSKDPLYLQKCARCLIKRICAQCPACSWMEHGTLDTPIDYYCQVAHHEARMLGFLKSEEWGWEVKGLHQPSTEV